MSSAIASDKIKRYLSQNNASALRRLLTRYNFADLAEVMENQLDPLETVQCFQYLNVGQAAQVLTSLSEERQVACLSSLPTVMSSQILRLMPADDAVDILQELETEHTRKILDEMPFDRDTKTIQHLLLEEPDTAAGIMSTDFIYVSIEATVGDAMAAVKRAEEKDFIYYVYLVNQTNQLLGVVSLKRLILMDESVPLQRVALFDTKSILVSYDQELVANLFRKYYNLLAMPVVDNNNELRGIITLDDVLDVIDEETSEDIYLASGINLDEMDEKNLLHGPLLNTVKARLPWLSITLVGQFLASAIISSYHHTVSAAVIAVSFMPMLTGLSGNMGTQTETISVRGLALDMISPENIKAQILREAKVGLVMGSIFAVTAGIASYLLYNHWELSLLLSAWILVSLSITATVGVLFPYIYRHVLKQDPAGVCGPFITTMSDILTFSIFLYVVTLLLDRLA